MTNISPGTTPTRATSDKPELVPAVTSRTRLRLPWSVRIWWIGSALVLAGVGWFKSINLLLLLGYVLLALIGVNAWVAWRTVARLGVSRRPSGSAFPDESISHSVEVANHSLFPITALISDHSEWNRSAWFLAPLKAGQSQALTAHWKFSTRGRHIAGPLVVETSYPFGLVQAVREFPEPGEILILPRVGRMDLDRFRRWLARGASGEHHSPRPSRRAVPGVGDVRGLRPYRPGDSPRDIHWRSSARRNQLLVREYDRGDPVGLVLVIDPWVPERDATTNRDLRLEWVLSLATTIGRTWCDMDDGSNLTLILPGHPPVVRSGRCTPDFVRQAFVVLADLAGTSNVSTTVPPQARGSNRSARLVVSTRASSPMASALHSAGLSCRSIDPSMPLAWFVPPEENKL